jgi:hypothetical protein
MPPNQALAVFERYASPYGAAYDIQEVFTAFHMDHEDRERDKLLNPHGG